MTCVHVAEDYRRLQVFVKAYATIDVHVIQKDNAHSLNAGQHHTLPCRFATKFVHACMPILAEGTCTPQSKLCF